MAAILVTTLGSWGDLFPLLGVAAELRARGHDVRVGASPAWADIVAEAEVGFAPIGRRIGFEDFARHPEIFGRMPFGLRTALRRFLFDQIDDVTADLRRAMDAVDVVVSHPAHLPALSVAESLGIRRVVGTVFPSMIPSVHTVPGGTPIGPWRGPIGRLANRAAWAGASLSTAALFDGPVNEHRRALGLEPVRAALLRVPMAADRTVVLAAPAVVGRPSDWPERVVTTSFVTWDRARSHPVSEPIEAFLAAGEPPVLVTLGASTAIAAEDFFEHTVGRVVEAGARALVVTGPAAAPPMGLDPARVHVAAYAPFSEVAHRCRAAVHHAGIGTTVAMLRAGVPQLAVPRGFDQPVTARLVAELGVGVVVPWRRRHRRMGRAVRRLLDDDGLRRRALDLAARIGPDDGAPAAADAIERR